MKTLLVIPRTVGSSFGYSSFPIGIAYISSSLKQAGHDVHILDLNKHYSPVFHIKIIQMLIKRKIMDIGPGIVATGGLSSMYDQIFGIVEAVRSIDPRILTVIGGGCVSSEPELIMENIHADFGIIGEGEHTIVELFGAIEARNIDFGSVDGIIFRQQNMYFHHR